LILSAKITNAEETEASIRQKISISRNTLKAIINEAVSLKIATRDDNRVISVATEFYDAYMESYLVEWKMMDPDSAKALSVALQRLPKKYITMSVGNAIVKALEFTVLSRAESVKADRKIKLSDAGEGDGLNLSSWVVVNSFNRDLLLLLMSAAITDNYLSISEIMRRLHVSRNAVKTALRVGIDGGFIIESNGYSCSGEALKGYLNWHYAVFSSYSDDLLSASAIFYEYLAQ
jgi:biotin operon repressor